MRTPGERSVYAILYPSAEGPITRRLQRALAFIVGAPWLLVWWGPRMFARMAAFFVMADGTFELDYREVLERASREKPITGVLHVGANVGQEAKLYSALGIPRVVWIECQAECRATLEANIAAAGRTETDAIAIEAVASCTGQQVQLHRVDNSISTSLKPLGKGHKVHFPFLQQLPPTPVTTVTLDDLLARRGLEGASFDFLYLDVQGSEIDVLRGATRTLSHVRNLMTEVSSCEHYTGGTDEEELHRMLVGAGFQRVQRAMPPFGHGNAFYARVSASTVD